MIVVNPDASINDTANLPAYVEAEGCAVHGCDHAVAFVVRRQLLNQNGVPKVLLLGYCPEHYSARCRFKAARR